MSVYKASLYNYLFNSINSIVVIINGIILVPLYFHYMPVSVYGAWLASGNLMAMIGLLSGGFAGVITQKMAAAISQKNKQEFLELAGTNIILAVIGASLIFVAAMILSSFVPGIVNVEAEFASDIKYAFQVSAISTSLALLVSLFGAFPQVWQETKQVGTINLVVNLLGIATTVIALIAGLGVISLPLGYVTRAVLNLLLQGRWIIKYWRKHEPQRPIYKLSKVPYIVKENVMPFTAHICSVLMGQSQSLILASAINPSLAAVYDLTSKIAVCLFNFVAMAKGSFFALLSLTFGKGDMKESNRVSSTIIQYFSIFIAIIIVLSMCFTKPIMHFWVALDKFGGDWLLLIIVFSTAIAQYKTLLNDFLFSGGQINRSARFDIFSLVLYIGLLAALVRAINEYALPTSMLIVNAVFTMLYMTYIKKYIGIDTNKLYGLIIKNGLITVPFILLYFIFPTDYSNIWLQVALLVIVSIILGATLLAANPEVYRTLRSKIKRERS